MCVCMHVCVCMMSLLETQSLWIISPGTFSASLRLGFSKVEGSYLLLGNSPDWGQSLTCLKALLLQQGILKVSISKHAQPLYLHIFLSGILPIFLWELLTGWADQLLSLLRVKWLTQVVGIQLRKSQSQDENTRLVLHVFLFYHWPSSLDMQGIKSSDFQGWACIRVLWIAYEDLLGPTLQVFEPMGLGWAWKLAFLLFYFYFLMEIYLIYNAVFIFAVQQNNSFSVRNLHFYLKTGNVGAADLKSTLWD